jgi:hypothetical protein
MSFDPTKPVEGTEIDAAELRNQFNGLKTLLDAVPAGPPGPQGPAGAEGAPGAQGPQGNDGRSVVNVYDDGMGRAVVQMSDGTTYGPFTIASGPAGADGAPGPQGPMGEATMGDIQNAVNNAIAGTSNNSNSVSILDMTISDPPTQTDVQNIASRLDQLILALRR